MQPENRARDALAAKRELAAIWICDEGREEEPDEVRPGTPEPRNPETPESRPSPLVA